MGLLRKITSLTTLGAVDFRSDKERTAAYTRATRNQARKQTQIMKRQARAGQPQPWYNQTLGDVIANRQQIQAPTVAPPGWYPNLDGTEERLWDGSQWTDLTRPAP